MPYKNLSVALREAPTDTYLSIRKISIDELNNLPTHITHLKVKYLAADGAVIVRRVNDISEENPVFRYECDEVNNLPMSLEKLTIGLSIIPQSMIRVPYGTKLKVKRHAIPPTSAPYTIFEF